MRGYRPGMLGADTTLDYQYAPAPAPSNFQAAQAPVAAGGGAAAGGAAASTGMMASPVAGGAIVAGGSALTAILERMYQEQLARKQAIQAAMAHESDVAGQYGRNQQAMLAQLFAAQRAALE